MADALETLGMIAREAGGPDETARLATVHTTAITIMIQIRVANFIVVSQHRTLDLCCYS